MLWSAKYSYDYLWSKQKERKLLVTVKQRRVSLLCDASKKRKKRTYVSHERRLDHMKKGSICTKEVRVLMGPGVCFSGKRCD